MSEELLVGMVAAALLPAIAWRIGRGLREGRLPVYRTSLARDDGPAKFRALLAFHVASFIVVAIIAADLLFELGLRDAL
jgi:hypothetical protein